MSFPILFLAAGGEVMQAHIFPAPSGIWVRSHQRGVRPGGQSGRGCRPERFARRGRAEGGGMDDPANSTPRFVTSAGQLVRWRPQRVACRCAPDRRARLNAAGTTAAHPPALTTAAPARGTKRPSAEASPAVAITATLPAPPAVWCRSPGARLCRRDGINDGFCPQQR